MATESCSRCNGTGKRKMGMREIECGLCDGTGKKEKRSSTSPGGITSPFRSRFKR